jgi:hydrogenase maturation protein HypF
MSETDPVSGCITLLRQGKIVAIKGLGGYHLAVDAGNEEAVRTLRRRKGRDEKPFALMAYGLVEVARFAEVETEELRLLTSVERPIVLLRKKNNNPVCDAVAPGNNYFGVMLPYTPLHYLLTEKHFPALVMTSANLSDEPIAFEDDEARRRLAKVADYFLCHNRRIHIRTDDSIVRIMDGRPLVLRRSRGFVPRGILLPAPQPAVLAVGAELKNVVCLTQEDRAFLSQHVGDLKNAEVFHSFEQTIAHLEKILQLRPEIIAHDLHPDYFSTRYAEARSGIPRVAVQHHHAHLASCLAENRITTEAIGVIFDGIGHGADGCAWGGEFLVGDFSGYRRAGHLAYVPMPGGDAATREPLRMAVSYLYQAFGAQLPPLAALRELEERDLRLLLRMMDRGINSPLTSSCGRLFDAVAAITGLRRRVTYEGQAALELEMAIDAVEEDESSYPYRIIRGEKSFSVACQPLIHGVVEDTLRGIAVSIISRRFHNTVAALIEAGCVLIRGAGGPNQIALSGGVFQNRFLTEKAVRLLKANRFQVITHSLVPPNDGGLALGQAVIAGALNGH